jgi:hypothetical protein
MKRKIVQSAVIGSVLLLSASQAFAVPLMHLDIGGSGASASIASGESITVSVFASDIPAGSDSNGMFGFGFDITFESLGLSASNLGLGPLWQFTGFDDTLDTAGRVGLTSNRFFLSSGPSGDDILLATIDFQGLAPGVYDLTLGYFTGVGDNVLFDSTTLDGAASFFGSGSISVPEPRTSALFLLGLLVLSGCRRR